MALLHRERKTPRSDEIIQCRHRLLPPAHSDARSHLPSIDDDGRPAERQVYDEGKGVVQVDVPRHGPDLRQQAEVHRRSHQAVEKMEKISH